MSDLAFNIITWLFLWGFTWLLYFEVLMRFWKFDYILNAALTSLYFLAAAALVYGVFSDILTVVFQELTTQSLIPIALLFIVTAYIYYFAARHLKRPKQYLHENPYLQWLSFDFRFLASKTTEILFQQMLIAVLVILLHSYGAETLAIMIAFALLFGLVHMPLIWIESLEWGIYFTVFAMLSAVVFPLLILMEGGIVYSFAVHSLFYTVSGIIIRWYLSRNITKAKQVLANV